MNAAAPVFSEIIELSLSYRFSGVNETDPYWAPKAISRAAARPMEFPIVRNGTGRPKYNIRKDTFLSAEMKKLGGRSHLDVAHDADSKSSNGRVSNANILRVGRIHSKPKLRKRKAPTRYRSKIAL